VLQVLTNLISSQILQTSQHQQKLNLPTDKISLWVYLQVFLLKLGLLIHMHILKLILMASTPSTTTQVITPSNQHIMVPKLAMERIILQQLLPVHHKFHMQITTIINTITINTTITHKELTLNNNSRNNRLPKEKLHLSNRLKILTCKIAMLNDCN